MLALDLLLDSRMFNGNSPITEFILYMHMRKLADVNEIFKHIGSVSSYRSYVGFENRNRYYIGL